MANNIENVNKLREYIKKNKGKNYPIKNHPLTKSTEYIKNIYLKMLCVILQYGNDVLEEQTLFLQRIISGTSVENTVEDYMRQAINIEIKDFEEFVNQMKNEDIKYCFLVDAMILVNVSSNNESRQNELIAEIVEMLGVTKNDLSYIVLVAKSILEQSSETYSEAEKIRPKHINYDLFSHHTMDYLAGVICCTERKLHIGSNTKKKVDIGKILYMVSEDKTSNSYIKIKMDNGSILYKDFMKIFNNTTKKSSITEVNEEEKITISLKSHSILFENIILDLNKYILVFSENENIVFKNCVFMNSCSAMNFENCKDINIEGCEFREFTPNRTICLNNVDSMILEKCYFSNCKYSYSKGYPNWESIGGVIYSKSGYNYSLKIKINLCEFKDCGGMNKESYCSSDIISNCITTVSNSKFISCWNYNRSNIDYDDSRRRLFPTSTTSTDNEIIGSAKVV